YTSDGRIGLTLFLTRSSNWLPGLMLHIFNDIKILEFTLIKRLNLNLSEMLANLAAHRNGLNCATALLDGDRLAASINDIFDRSSSRPRAAGPTTAEDEASRLFK
ncbi:hypothetical protein CHS0354_012323, partial [Potamilus streckersoni]